MVDISFSDLTARLDAINGRDLHAKISNFSCIDEKGMKLEYYNNSYICVDNLEHLCNNTLYITGLPASGKTELAERLSAEYGIPVISLDDMANNEFDFSNETVLKYIEDSQSDNFEQISGDEAENFLGWLRKSKNPARAIVEGYQIYRMNYKTGGKFYNSLIENNEVSMIIVNSSPQTIVRNRIARDGVDESFAQKETKRELAKLKEAFPGYVKTTENFCH